MRSIGKEYLEQEAWHINAEMTQAGDWIDKSGGFKTIVLQCPNNLYKMLCKVLPKYRKLAWKLIQHFKQSAIKQGAEEKMVNEEFNKRFKW